MSDITPHHRCISIVVRGQFFPSRKACALHFNVTHQTVSAAVERGTEDGIGLGRNAWRKKKPNKETET